LKIATSRAALSPRNDSTSHHSEETLTKKDFSLKKMYNTFFIALLLFIVPLKIASAKSQVIYPFSSPSQQEQFNRLIEQTRCLVCKNQNIAESQTPIAKDLKQKIYELIQKKYSDEAIKTYLVERYGDFILFQPLFKPSTYLLWFTPFLLLIMGLIILLYILYQRQKK
jgi:cytochrome c-type biogenesis protein CcmH